MNAEDVIRMLTAAIDCDHDSQPDKDCPLCGDTEFSWARTEADNASEHLVRTLVGTRLATAEKERQGLREALREIAEESEADERVEDGWTWCINIARAALATPSEESPT